MMTIPRLNDHVEINNVQDIMGKGPTALVFRI